MRIQVGDLRIGEEEKRAINEVLESGRISEGPKVSEFEREFAKFVGTRYAVVLNSGTSALIAGLMALKYRGKQRIKPKTRVITTPLTYISTVNALVLCGFKPVFVDVDKDTFGITPDAIKEELENKEGTRDYSMILPVHLMGYPCDMKAINQIAEKYRLVVFEDAAQAHGSTYEGRRCGSLSLLSAFSFYIAHNIQAGEMGAIATDDLEIVKLVKQIKANGRMCDCPICRRAEGKCPRLISYQGEDDFDPRFTHNIVGYNFKTTEFQAALAITQLRKADWIVRRRRENVRYLNSGLESLSHLFQLPRYDATVSYLAYPVIIKDSQKVSRRRMRQELEKRGVETRPLFGCIATQQPAYRNLRSRYQGKLPNAEFIGLNGFYVGCHQYLEKDDLDYMIKAFKEALQEV